VVDFQESVAHQPSEPRPPGLSRTTTSVVPEVFVSKQGDEFNITTNNEQIPAHQQHLQDI
jgi:DNA-directed RNA polymerase specialized sigma54-like protein